MEEMQEKIRTVFAERLGGDGTLYAPAGCTNLIGEHTAYNGGCVFTGAIDKVSMS